MIRMTPLAVVIALLLGIAAAVQAADVYDAVADFSNVTNTDTSTWSYRIGDSLTRDGNYALMTEHNGDPGDWEPDRTAWRPATPGTFAPGIGVNTGGDVAFTANSNAFTWDDDTIWIHPDQDRLAVISWLAPDDGTADLAFAFADMDPNDNLAGTGADGVSWWVDLNTDATLDSGSFLNGGSSGAQAVSNIAVAQGDRIHFIVSPNSFWFFDSTEFTGTVTFTAVPTPGSFFGAIPLLFALASRRRLR